LPWRKGSDAAALREVEIGRPAEEVWRLLGERERWAEGMWRLALARPITQARTVGTTTSSGRGFKEQVSVRVVRSEKPVRLEEAAVARAAAVLASLRA
jgi:uncharacterized protein YndB with AHSA1/START domain